MANYINPLVLSQFVVDHKFPEQKFIADEILTKVEVKETSAQYSTFAKYSAKKSDDEVAYKSSSSELDLMRMPVKASYTTRHHAHKVLVQKEDQNAYKSWMDLVAEQAYNLKRQLLLNKEIEVKALVDAGSYSSTPNPKWNGTNPTIEKDISDAINAFKNNAGVRPNTLIIPAKVWRVVAMDSTLREIWKLVPSRADQDIKLSSLMKMLFENFTKILIPDVTYDTAEKGKPEVSTDLWGDTVSLIYTVARGTRDTFTWATRFVKSELYTKTWDNPDKDIEGTWVKVGYEEDRKQVCATALYNLTDCLG